MNTATNIYFKCDDNAETVVFTKFAFDDGDVHYDISVEDAYCGGDYMGIKGRFKRAWHAFFAKPIYYTGVFSADEKRVKKFLEECLRVIEEA